MHRQPHGLPLPPSRQPMCLTTQQTSITDTLLEGRALQAAHCTPAASGITVPCAWRYCTWGRCSACSGVPHQRRRRAAVRPATRPATTPVSTALPKPAPGGCTNTGSATTTGPAHPRTAASPTMDRACRLPLRTTKIRQALQVHTCMHCSRHQRHTSLSNHMCICVGTQQQNKRMGTSKCNTALPTAAPLQ